MVLTEFATSKQQRHNAGTDPAHRKRNGHFGTPPVVAEYMAGLFPTLPRNHIRILDPGAGVGTLTAALCDRIAKLKVTRRVTVELWENDPTLIPYLQQTMDECKRVLGACGHFLEWTIHVSDFVLAHAQRSLFDSGPQPRFDLVVMNPPYLKLRKESVQAQAMSHLVHGQPNLYALFMALGAELLKPRGYLVAITPRSYFNGPYFRTFRLWFLKFMAPLQIHLFESRTSAFRADNVLQENVILCARKTDDHRDILLTSSAGRDFRHGYRECKVPYSRVIHQSRNDRIIRVTTCPFEQELLEFVDRLPHRLRDLGLEISTGPVVSFRARQYLLHKRDASRSAPLLWLHNIRPFVIRFLPSNKKPTHIRISEPSLKLLLPAKRYVLLKRFTAKEEARRLVAAVVRSQDSYSPLIGLENHLNYVHRPHGELTEHEALGLAAILNSAQIDRYFRAISGNTQVNAAEIRELPLPDLHTIVKIGRQIEFIDTADQEAVDQLVSEELGLPFDSAASLCETRA